MNSSNERKFSCAYENDFARSTYYFEKACFFSKRLVFFCILGYNVFIPIEMGISEISEISEDNTSGTAPVFSRKGYTHDV